MFCPFKVRKPLTEIMSESHFDEYEHYNYDQEKYMHAGHRRNLTQPHPTAQIVDNPMEMLRSQKNHNKVCCYQISDDISTVFWFFLSLIITSHSHTQCPITKIGLPYRP
ncbi:unnamed protein product [Allacma fusca]|uniref:Uncharacterized protein n=1 Tax=Allacma fusca TaxID=39272 RepID=A0A8J2K4P6_9HEXA|nr:unnamed protein product [Allacma fusca]